MVGQEVFLALRKVPFVRVCLFFMIGNVVGYYAPLPPLLFMGIQIGIAAMLLFLVAIEICDWRWTRMVFPSVFYTLMFLWGIIWIARELPAQQGNYFTAGGAGQLIGIVVDEPVYGERTIRFPVDIQYTVQDEIISKATGRIMLSVVPSEEGSSATFSYGNRLLFQNTVVPVRPAYNPKQFDYRRYLAHKNIYYQGYLQADDVEVIQNGGGNAVVGMALDARQYLVAKFSRYISDKEALEVCSALILGYRANFQAETLEAFINTGTVHVLSVSGLHVGMVFFLLNFLLGFLDKLRYGRALRFVVILLTIWGYVLLTGMAPSILRAGVMISFLLLAGWGRRTNHNINSLFASAFFLLLLDPFMLFDMGFQLSYLAVIGLFTLYPLLRKMFAVRNRWINPIVQAIWVSISAQLFTTPLALYYFHQFPNYFLLGNLFVMIPATALMYVGLALAVLPFSVLNVWFGVVLAYLSRFLLWGLKTIEGLPFAILQGIDLSVVGLVLFLFMLFFLLLAWYTTQKYFLWASLTTLALLVLSTSATSLQYRAFQGIKVYNVGKEVAIAVIDRGSVRLFSTLDSSTHPRLVMQVLPDIHQYAPKENIVFQPLLLVNDEQLVIQTAIGTIGIIEGNSLIEKCVEYDMLLWRNTVPYRELDGGHIGLNTHIVLDASNSGLMLDKMRLQADSSNWHYYVLKDNFTYVWEKKRWKAKAEVY